MDFTKTMKNPKSRTFWFQTFINNLRNNFRVFEDLQKICNKFFNINNKIQLFILGYRNLSKFTRIRSDISYFFEIISFVNNGNRVTLCNFWRTKFLFFESDFNAANSSRVKFKGAPLSL